MTDFLAYLHQQSPLGVESKVALHHILEVRDLARGELVQQPGSLCKTIYFVQTGLARIFYYKDGNDITEHFAFANQLIVRAESLFTQQPTKKGIQTLEPTRLVVIDAKMLFDLYDKHHDIERLFRVLFEREHVNTIRRLESLQFHTARERYEELLTETDLIRHIPLKHIASYLGITQVSLSRIRVQLS